VSTAYEFKYYKYGGGNEQLPPSIDGPIIGEANVDYEYSFTTFDLVDYTLYYFEVDADGVKQPVQNINVPTVTLGENTPIGIPSAHGNPSVSVILYGADSLVIDQSSGVAVGSIPTLTATVSGGAWSASSTDNYTGIRFSSIAEGANTVVATQTDANGATTDSASIDVFYQSSAPILEIDGQKI